MPYIPTMPKNRILPALGIAALIPLTGWVQTPSAPPAGSVQAAQAKAKAQAAVIEPPTEAEKTLDAAIKKVAALKSMAADLTESVDMLDQKFTIRGRYLKAPGHRIYLQLKVSGLADSTAQMLQVCDGQTLWDYQQVLDTQVYGKLEVGPVFEKMKAPELEDLMREQVTAQLGFAGPDELLRGIRKIGKFDQQVGDTFDGKAVWLLTGEWKSRDGLVAPNQQPLSALAPLPAYVPSLIKVWVGKDDGWPYKVRLVGRLASDLSETRKIIDGKPVGSAGIKRKVQPTVIEIVYSDVKLNPELKTDEFAFTPPRNARVDDRTQSFVGMLDQAIQFRAAAKKAEAAKGEEPLLKQSIDLPKIDAPAPLPASPPPRN